MVCVRFNNKEYQSEIVKTGALRPFFNFEISLESHTLDDPVELYVARSEDEDLVKVARRHLIVAEIVN